MTDTDPLILVLRAAATADGAVYPAADYMLRDLTAAENRMLIRRLGMAAVWKITPRGKIYLEAKDVPTSDG